MESDSRQALRRNRGPFSAKVIRLLYNLLWPIGLLLFLPRYLVKMFRRGGYRKNFGQRFALYDVDLRARLATQRSIWVHAVSVGEIAIALKLIRAIERIDRAARFVLTTTTTTAFASAKKELPASAELLYAPLDFWPIMRRAFATIRPAKIVLVEAEVWPNLVAEATARRIPIALVNARLSPRSERRFARFRVFVRPMFRLLDLVTVPDAADVARWQRLGVGASRVQPVGSVKYDPENTRVDPTAPGGVLHHLKIDNRPILLGGSTHPGEEEMLAEVGTALRNEFRNLVLVFAPRHAERAVSIARTLEQMNLQVVLRSRTAGATGAPDCLIIDTTGELRNWYAVASVVFIGKSLLARGGQNPAEAILAGKPVVFGPHMENFAAFAEALVKNGGAVRIESRDELRGALADLLRDEDARARLVANAQRVLAMHTGATDRTARLVVELKKAEDHE